MNLLLMMITLPLQSQPNTLPDDATAASFEILRDSPGSYITALHGNGYQHSNLREGRSMECHNNL